ncbi:MAG: O-antigen ligase family protein [Vibrio metschnikovii]|uniref:O-antigen ligase family protein n=1 Tax=Vibrio metschnikovii TaxID=28172 RepID=UPI0001B959B0|nr:O-antigen ligase family protein [Vibrio metschnikovii]EEX35784.1 RfaL protein [Vibrio metschnikovii CIP 69.14]EKO3572801.1 O-antigen ligase family protein [Vibrio metschnikovii]EKO3900138.1 O-antigen ligase family protein [Vibrio metschnikovii]MDM7484264.1 O-antigen ligase family protein [Vibrio metschnikovii]SUP07848.1 O-antigen ligase [Vibrio metschnikovii]
MIKPYNTRYNNLISLVLCSFPVFCLALGKGYNYPAILLLITSLLTCSYWVKKATFTRPVIIISITFIAYFASYLLSWFVYDGKLSDLDQASRFILVLPILFMLIHFRIRSQWFFYSLCIGAIIAGIISIIHVYHMDFSRAFTGQNSHWWLRGYMPIQSGNMAMTLGFLALAISFYALKTRQFTLLIVSLLGSFGGVLASFLSGSRGAWIAVPFVLLYLLWANKSLLNKKIIVIISVITIGIALTISSIDRVQDRVATAVHEIQQYEQDNRYSSLGIRFELWKNALLTFKTSPLIGVGEVERYTLQKIHGDQGLIDYKVAHNFFSHAHNQYLEDLSIRGLVGLTALLALFLIPLKLSASRYVNPRNPKHQLVSQLVIVHILLFIFYQLTQAMFSHNSGTIFFSVMTVALLSLVYTIEPLENEQI